MLSIKNMVMDGGDWDKYEDGDDTYEDRMIFVQEHPFLIRAVESVDGTGICVSGLSRDNGANSGGSGSYGISKEDSGIVKEIRL